MLEDSFAFGESFSVDDAPLLFQESFRRNVLRYERPDLTTVIDIEEEEDEFDNEDDEPTTGPSNETTLHDSCTSLQELEAATKGLSLSNVCVPTESS